MPLIHDLPQLHSQMKLRCFKVYRITKENNLIDYGTLGTVAPGSDTRRDCEVPGSPVFTPASSCNEVGR